MNQRTNLKVIVIGRMLGLVIIVLGIGVSAWDALDLPSFSYSVGILYVLFPPWDILGFLLSFAPAGGGYKLRLFLHGLLASLQSGAVLFIVAEIAARVGSGAGHGGAESQRSRS
jgi:hypothetical protein